MCNYLIYWPLQEFSQDFTVISLLDDIPLNRELFLKLETLLYRYTAAGLSTLMALPETCKMCLRYCALHPSVINSG